MRKTGMVRSLLVVAGLLMSAVVATAAPQKAPAAAAPAPAGKTIEMSVTEKGFEPDVVKVKKGEPVTLVITRKTDKTCATEIVIDEEKISTKLPLNKAVTVTFTPKDILGFLGRKWDRRFDGDVHTEIKTDRILGTRIKHRMTRNWLKMYDKFGQVLRIETVINNPREFKVRRRVERKGQGQMAWCPMNKSVINLYRYREVASAANERYLEALSVVENPAPAYRQVEKITERAVKAGRSYAGFNPASRSDVKLFEAVLDGNHVVRGFRNVDIREALNGTTANPTERRRESAAIGRLLKRLHVRGLIRKVPRSRRWHVTPKGYRVLQGVLQLYYRGIPAALGTAA
jgi:plastocyanin